MRQDDAAVQRLHHDGAEQPTLQHDTCSGLLVHVQRGSVVDQQRFVVQPLFEGLCRRGVAIDTWSARIARQDEPHHVVRIGRLKRGLLGVVDDVVGRRDDRGEI